MAMAAVQMKAKEAKASRVSELAELVKGARVIAIADLRNLPDRHLQSLRRKLRGQAFITVAKNTLIQRALQQAGKALELAGELKGPSALIFTDMDPFRLYKFIKASRGKAAAKPGQVAPFDLIVPAGETALSPGPVLTELKQANIQAQIKGGKVVIAKDSIVAKAGEKISETAAKALQKLGIEPFEVGMELVAAWEDGIVYPGSVLNVDEKAMLARLQSAYMSAFNLSYNTVYPTKQNIRLLIAKAARESMSLAVNANIPEKEAMPIILAKAFAQASALKKKTS